MNRSNLTAAILLLAALSAAISGCHTTVVKPVEVERPQPEHHDDHHDDHRPPPPPPDRRDDRH
jgi:hypothetical protein